MGLRLTPKMASRLMVPLAEEAQLLPEDDEAMLEIPEEVTDARPTLPAEATEDWEMGDESMGLVPAPGRWCLAGEEM